MGVRGLQTFVERECPDACKYVSIKQMADDHSRKWNLRPVLVIDGMSLINNMYSKTDLEWIYGGQWLQLVKKMEEFIYRFCCIGVKLIFFFDGTVCSSKREEWVKRRITKYQEINAIFSEIKVRPQEPDRKNFMLPTSMGLLAAFALKELGAEVYQTVKEADDVIAEYAARNIEVFGILSQDSDFIICDTKAYLSLKHLDIDSLRTIYYDRNCLASQYLGLDVKLLPLFGCLVGNHFLTSEQLRHFHKRITAGGPIYVAAIAHNIVKIINFERWSGDFTNYQELNRISALVFGHTEFIQQLQDGLKSYAIGAYSPSPETCIVVHPSLEKYVYSQHLSCLIPPYIFNLLCKMEYGSSEVLEDLSKLPSALVYRPVRQRCYGVLFNYFLPSNHCSKQTLTKDGGEIAINEWCAYPGNYMEKPDIVPPLPLEGYFLKFRNEIPSIEDLWFKCSDVEKMQIFWSILQAPISLELLLTVPKHLIVLVCVLNYLIGGLQSGPMLKPWEVAVFIAQALWRKSVEELANLQGPWVDGEAINLSTLFVRGVNMVFMVFATCDKPFPISNLMPWHYFDGKLFHYLYTKAKERTSIKELCRNQAEIKEFYKLLPAVTNNTVYDLNRINWISILQDFEYNQIGNF